MGESVGADGGFGGAILNQGVLRLRDATLSHNRPTGGGATLALRQVGDPAVSARGNGPAFVRRSILEPFHVIALGIACKSERSTHSEVRMSAPSPRRAHPSIAGPISALAILSTMGVSTASGDDIFRDGFEPVTIVTVEDVQLGLTPGRSCCPIGS